MKNILKYTAVLLFIFVASLAFSQDNKNIEIENLTKHVTFLASDSLKGRKPGMAEFKYSANYIAKEFKAIGLKSFSDNYFQNFEVITNIELGKNNSLHFEDFTGKLNKDFMPLSFSSNSTIEKEIAFVGYGFDIDEDSLKWNDYKGIDVKDKWVIILRADPELDNANSKFIPYSKERSKVLVAKDKGAAGVIFVAGVDYEKKDKLMKSFFDKSATNSGVPVINITRELANKLIFSTNNTVEVLEDSIIKNHISLSFIINKKLKVSTENNPKVAKTQNIVGYIEGTDKTLKDEYIVFGAHFDHLGMGGEGSGSRQPDTIAVHNGADDNATGTASIIEIARKYVALKNNKRSVIFIAFSAEEMGLLGSKYFVANPIVELSKIKAMFNIDMVGRFNKETGKIAVGGTGTGDKIPEILNNNLGDDFKIGMSPDGYGPSDHASFYSKNIPVLFFSTGAHNDYHTPIDDVEFINFEMQTAITEYISKVGLDIINLDTNLVFAEAGSDDKSERSRRYKITFGIIPDFAGQSSDGLRVDGVRKGRPAYNAGMQKGDTIIAIDGGKVTNIYDYMFRLSKLKEGKTAIVEVMREKKKVVLLLQL